MNSHITSDHRILKIYSNEDNKYTRLSHGYLTSIHVLLLWLLCCLQHSVISNTHIGRIYRNTVGNIIYFLGASFIHATHLIGAYCMEYIHNHVVYAPSQWETTLHCNVVSYWLDAYTQWSLILTRNNCNSKLFPGTTDQNPEIWQCGNNPMQFNSVYCHQQNINRNAEHGWNHLNTNQHKYGQSEKIYHLKLFIPNVLIPVTWLTSSLSDN